MNYGDFPIEETIHVLFTTRAFATGIPGTLSAATVAVYEDITATPIETSIAVTESLNSIAGLNAVPIVAIAASGYEVGKNYHVVIEAGEVDSVSVVGEVVAYFSIGRSAAAVDLANSTDGLGALKTLIDALNDLSAADVNAQVDTALSDINLDHFVGTASGIPALPAGTYLDLLQDDGSATYSRSTDSLQAIRDHVGNGSNLTEAGGTGDHLSDLGGMSTGMKAEVQVEANDALVANGLDHFIGASGADTDVADNSLIAQLADAGATADWTNYKPTEDSLRRISEKVSSIGAASGGGFNFAAVGDDTITDTIDNLGVAVDKSTSPVTVGIPVTGHAFLAGHEVTIAGTDAYNGSFPIESVSTNEVVIDITPASFTAETFAGSDTIVSSIKATSLEGVQTTNTFAATAAEDAVYHVIDDDGSNNFTISYRFEIGGGRLATEAVFHGFLSSNNDNAFIQAYNFVASAWETRRLLVGQNGTVNQTITIPLLSRNTGSSGFDLGVVFLRLTDDTASGSSNPTLNTDSLLVEAIGKGQATGYENGQLWVDTVNGVAGTEDNVNGIASNPVLTWADALTLSASLGITDFHIINGSTIQLTANSDNFSLFGDNWTLDLNGQSIAGAHFEGATVSGTSSGTGSSFTRGDIGTVTIGDDTHFIDVGFIAGTITLPAGSLDIHACHHDADSLPIFDFGAGVGGTTLHMHSYSGGLTLHNFGDNGTDIVHLDGNGRVDINSNSAGGTLNVRGMWDVNDSGASTTINLDNTTEDVDAILVDTAVIGAAGVGLSDLGGMSTAMKAEVNAEVLDVMNTDTITLPGQTAPPLAPTHRQAIAWLYKVLRNRKTQTATEWNLLADDESTVDAKATVSDDGTTAIKQEIETGP